MAIAVVLVHASAQEWPVYGGDAGNTKYSSLKQINRGNVTQLKVAWTYPENSWSRKLRKLVSLNCAIFPPEQNTRQPQVDETRILDMEWWRPEGRGAHWNQVLGQEELESTSALRRCTYAGQPFGNESFVS